MAIENINVMSLNDFIDNPLKVYPYKFTNAKGAIAFVKEGATTIASAENTSDKPLKEDENGFFYFEVIPQMTEQGELTAQNNKVFGEIFENNISIEAYATNFPSSPEKDYIELGNHQLTPYFFTVGKPFDRQLYEEDQQEIFIVNNSINILDTELDNDLLVNEGYQEITFTNIKDLLNNYENATILPYVGIQPLNNPVIDIKGIQKPGFKFVQKTDMLLSRSKGITVKAQTQENEITDINFISQNPLTTFKTSPIDLTSNQLELYFDWFDYDVAAPLNIIKEFYTPNITRQVLSNDLDRKAFLDMIAISYAFITQFASFERYTSGSDIGKLIPGKYIGYVGFDIAGTATQSPITSLGNVYQKWLRDTRIDEGEKRARNLKNMIAMCSKFIGGKYSIGGADNEQIAGSNAFNEIYLPWFLKLTSSIVLKKIKIKNPIIGASNEVDTLVIDDSNLTTETDALLFQAQSRYFTQKTSQSPFEPTSGFNLSETVQIQSDRKLTLPPIDEEVEIIDKLPLPGDIDTKSSKDLKYFCVLPITDEVTFNKLMFNDADSQPPQTGIFDLNWTNEGFPLTTGPQLDAEIINQASNIYKVPKSAISIISRGTEESRTSSSYSVNKKFGVDYGGDVKSNTAISNADILELIRKDLGIPNTSTINIVSNNSRLITKLQNYTGISSTIYNYNYTYTLKSFRRVKVQIQLSTGFTYVPIRQSKYNKSQWQRFLSDLRLYNTLEFEHSLVSENEIPLERIKEIEIGSLWGEYVKFIINGVTFKIRLFQSDDEKIGRQKFIFY